MSNDDAESEDEEARQGTDIVGATQKAPKDLRKVRQVRRVREVLQVPRGDGHSVRIASSASMTSSHRGADALQMASGLHLLDHLPAEVPLVAFDQRLIDAWRTEGHQVA